MPVAGSRVADGSPSIRARVAAWLFGVSFAVLLIAVANVGNLVVARTIRRRRELGIRVALGATRARIAQIFLIEGLALSITGWFVALAIASGGTMLVRRMLLPDVEWGSVFLGHRASLFAAAAAVVIGISSDYCPSPPGVVRVYVPARWNQYTSEPSKRQSTPRPCLTSGESRGCATGGRGPVLAKPSADSHSRSGLFRGSRSDRHHTIRCA